VGERGTVAVDAFAQAITAYSRHLPRHPSWLNWGLDPNQAMIAEFIGSIREEREPLITWQDGYEALRVALACYASAEARQPVRLEHS
jgi:UDP-N-acetylglucosamine 3-dehydrogenase